MLVLDVYRKLQGPVYSYWAKSFKAVAGSGGDTGFCAPLEALDSALSFGRSGPVAKAKHVFMIMVSGFPGIPTSLKLLKNLASNTELFRYIYQAHCTVSLNLAPVFVVYAKHNHGKFVYFLVLLWIHQDDKFAGIDIYNNLDLGTFWMVLDEIGASLDLRKIAYKAIAKNIKFEPHQCPREFEQVWKKTRDNRKTRRSFTLTGMHSFDQLCAAKLPSSIPPRPRSSKEAFDSLPIPKRPPPPPPSPTESLLSLYFDSNTCVETESLFSRVSLHDSPRTDFFSEAESLFSRAEDSPDPNRCSNSSTGTLYQPDDLLFQVVLEEYNKWKDINDLPMGVGAGAFGGKHGNLQELKPHFKKTVKNESVVFTICVLRDFLGTVVATCLYPA